MSKRTILTGVVLFCLAAVMCGPWRADSLKGFPAANLHSDEVYWTAYSYMGYHVGFVQGNWTHDIWLLGDPHVGMTPWVGKFLIGGYLHALGMARAWNPRVVYWDYRQPLSWNINEQNVPSLAAIAAGRAFMVPFGIGLALIFSFILLQDTVVPGVLFFFLLASQPLYKFMSSRVFLDIPAMFFSGLSLFFFAYGRAMARSSRSGHRLFIALAGMTAGLAAAVKMREILLFFCYGALWLGLLIADRIRGGGAWTGEARRVFLVLLLAVTTFLAVNPGSYLAPVHSFLLFWNLSEFQQEEVRKLAPQNSLVTLPEKMNRFREVVFSEFARHSWAAVWEIPCVIGGAVFLVLGIWRRPFSLDNPQHLLFAYFLVVFAVNLWWLPQNYERYFLPLLFLWSFLEALGIAQVILFLGKRLRLIPTDHSVGAVS
jgi:hypothetical protein